MAAKRVLGIAVLLCCCKTLMASTRLGIRSTIRVGRVHELHEYSGEGSIKGSRAGSAQMRDSDTGDEAEDPDNLGVEIKFKILIETTREQFFASQLDFITVLADLAQIGVEDVYVTQVVSESDDNTRQVTHTEPHSTERANLQDTIPVGKQQRRSVKYMVRVWVIMLVADANIGPAVASRLDQDLVFDALRSADFTPLDMSEITLKKQLTWSMKGVPEAQESVPAADSFQEEEDDAKDTANTVPVILICIIV
eukprot:1959518-Rhodomonas_salina.1